MKCIRVQHGTQAAKEIPADLFSFRITGADGYSETVSNVAGGGFSFTDLAYNASDIGHTYTYTIEEARGDKGYITYDAVKHTLVVFVTDDGEFTFGLYRDGKQVDAATNVNSTFTLKDSFKATELGEYTYTVSEVKGNATGVTYDDTVYTVKVKVSDNGKGGVAVDYSIANGSKLLFENVYTPPVTPETGDNFNMAVFLGLMILSSFGLAAVVICKKHDEAKEEAN